MARWWDKLMGRKFYTQQEFDKLDRGQQAYAATMGYVPYHWYSPDDSTLPSCSVPTTTNFSWVSTRNNYDDCHDTLVQVEDAIRESNPVLQETPHLIERG